MKIKKDFAPITITLETPEDVQQLRNTLTAACIRREHRFFGDTHDIIDKNDFANRILSELK
jgi:hypothetical protein